MLDNNSNNNGENTGKEIREQKIEEIYRVTVTKDADESLTKIVDRANDGFDAGKISRTEAVTWILNQFARGLSEATIQEIRAEHFDEMAMFESLFRKAKKTGKIPTELRGLLQRQVGFDAPSNKKPREKVPTRLTNDFINDETYFKPEA